MAGVILSPMNRAINHLRSRAGTSHTKAVACVRCVQMAASDRCQKQQWGKFAGQGFTA